MVGGNTVSPGLLGDVGAVAFTTNGRPSLKPHCQRRDAFTVVFRGYHRGSRAVMSTDNLKHRLGTTCESMGEGLFLPHSGVGFNGGIRRSQRKN